MTQRTVDNPKIIASWSLYDWANSAFTTLVVTFIYSIYFSKAIAPDEISGTVLWSRAVSASAIAIAVLSPIAGAVADRGGLRRRFLVISTAICIAATAALAFVEPGQANSVILALTIFMIANVAFEMGIVFYNAYLPDIASPPKIGRVSGYGWGLGYLGGLVCLGLALAVFVRDEPLFGISTVDGFNVRATNLLVAGWFALFSIPFLILGKDEPGTAGKIRIGEAFGELRETFRQIRRYKQMVKFLIARLIYNDGLITIFAFGGIYAAGTFGMELKEIIRFGIMINVTAGLGAFLFGFVDDKLGGKQTVLISIAALSVITVAAVFAPNKTWFWIVGLLIGIFVGPSQSASRSLMGRFVPRKHQTEFFGFFAFSGKFTAFLGPLFLGAATQLFNNQRAGIATVLLFFIVGGALLMRVDEEEGIRAAAGDGGGR